MTRIAYFDMPAGISGDMTLAAFIHAGLSLDDLTYGLAPLGLSGYTLRAEPANQHSLGGTRVIVEVEADQPQRDWRTIRSIIEGSGLTERAKELSLRIFGALAVAEASVHGVAVDDVHFHEVGALDSIVDIVGTAVALDLLGVEAIYASPFAQGHGWTQSQHGLIPVPAPATLALLAHVNAPTVPLETDKETVTPTGAAIVTALAEGFEQPPMTVQAVGYGFGTRRMPWPNCLRIWLGATVSTHRGDAPFATTPVARETHQTDVGTSTTENEILLSANIDDMTPEALAYALERLFAAGALDAWFTPITMKKSRPAVQLSAICADADRLAVTTTLLRETTTFGVRATQIAREKANRRWETVVTQWGPVRVKIKEWGGAVLDAVPEYEQIAAIARAAEVPFREVYAAAAEAGRQFVGARLVEVHP
ncbi:MAG: nickel pincer cofactor biosynthesis protein LarC [Chloroflexota bacterium]|nr:nickel pincer cofactor biosynthesis protein LarC [Chloroflexota bacterium]